MRSLAITSFVGFGPLAVEGVLAEGSGVLGYLLVFVLAAIPVIEVLLVIPPAIALGYHPVAVTVLAFLGNALTVWVVILFHERVLRWLRSRRDGGRSARAERARRLWTRYGLVPLAVVSPVATGVHLGAVLALTFGSPRRSVTLWMTLSLSLWSVAIALLTLGGLSLIASVGAG